MILIFKVHKMVEFQKIMLTLKFAPQTCFTCGYSYTLENLSSRFGDFLILIPIVLSHTQSNFLKCIFKDFRGIIDILC